MPTSTSQARTVGIVVLLATVLILSGCVRDTQDDTPIYPYPESVSPRAVRLPDNPIITPDMLPGDDGDNINGPSLIKVPEWVENPLGKYYLYFANHRGKYIRMAYADSVAGPWSIYEPGVMPLEETSCLQDRQEGAHIASPDVHVDHENEKILMFFHCKRDPNEPIPLYRIPNEAIPQVTFRSLAPNGLSFEAEKEYISHSYFKAVKVSSQWIGINNWVGSGSTLYSSFSSPRRFKKQVEFRHLAGIVRGDSVYVFTSIRGDRPEHIVVQPFDIYMDPADWDFDQPRTLVEVKYDWEGVDLKLKPSKGGVARKPVHQLRDPAVYEENGKTWLLYSVAGEQGIAIAELIWD